MIISESPYVNIKHIFNFFLLVGIYYFSIITNVRVLIRNLLGKNVIYMCCKIKIIPIFEPILLLSERMTEKSNQPFEI